MPFPSRAEYEQLLYSLPEQFPEIETSTLRLYSTSKYAASVKGQVHFRNGLVLRVTEVVDLRAELIQTYSYTVLRGEERVRWYDPQPHPEQPDLLANFPHHRHEPPAPAAQSDLTIKHNRRPAPGISFEAENLTTLIADCIELGKSLGLG